MNNTQKFLQNKSAVCAAIALIGYFLPWISMGPMSFSAYEFQRFATMMKHFGGEDNGGSNDTMLTLFYLFPLSLAAIIAGNFVPQLKQLNKISVGVAVALIAYVTFMLLNKGGLGAMSIGFYVSVIATAALGYFTFVKKEAASETTPPIEGTTESRQVVNTEASKIPTFDFAKWFSRNRKVIIASVAIIALGCAGYFIFFKNSYQKTIAALEHRNWEEVIYNYEKTIAEVNDDKLKLNYDEKKKLNIARWIADKMMPIEGFRSKYYSTDRSKLQAYFDLDKRWTALPSLKSKPLEGNAAGVDVNEIYKPYVLFTDSFNLAFAELIVSENTVNFKNTSVTVDQLSKTLQEITSNIEIILERVIDTQNETVKSRVEKINSNLSQLQKAVSDLIAEKSTQNEQSTGTDYLDGLFVIQLGGANTKSIGIIEGDGNYSGQYEENIDGAQQQIELKDIKVNEKEHSVVFNFNGKECTGIYTKTYIKILSGPLTENGAEWEKR